jgi:DivIVA domain-containing protein
VLHLFLYGLLAVAIAVLLFALAARFLPAGEQIAPPLRDEPPWDLPPDRPLTADDVDDVRLPVALRGYRFAETDLLLDRLAGELRARDAEIDRLRGGGMATRADRPANPAPAPAQAPAATTDPVPTTPRTAQPAAPAEPEPEERAPETAGADAAAEDPTGDRPNEPS